LLDQLLFVLTYGGRRDHGDYGGCDGANGTHWTLWRTPPEICSDFAAYWMRYAKNDPDMNDLCPHVRNMLLHMAAEGDPNEFCWLLKHCTGKALMTTEHDVLGPGPPGARIGDVVALFGGNAPFVLRPQSLDSDNPSWELIGDCFIQTFRG
jgi:hypothetical protein